jgi:hypothetical protein
MNLFFSNGFTPPLASSNQQQQLKIWEKVSAALVAALVAAGTGLFA